MELVRHLVASQCALSNEFSFSNINKKFDPFLRKKEKKTMTIRTIGKYCIENLCQMPKSTWNWSESTPNNFFLFFFEKCSQQSLLQEQWKNKCDWSSPAIIHKTNQLLIIFWMNMVTQRRDKERWYTEVLIKHLGKFSSIFGVYRPPCNSGQGDSKTVNI